MLSRHADSLFWLGRYFERATGTARMLDVTYHAVLESPQLEAEPAWRDLLDALGVTGRFDAVHDHASAQTVPSFLVTDTANGVGLISLIGRARENARSVRELLSTELWEAINSLWLELAHRDLHAEVEREPYTLLRLMRRRLQEISGAAVETMPHDDGWRFMLLGWMLERAEHEVRLLAVRLAPAAAGQRPFDFHDAVDLLKSASALQAFRRTYPGALSLENVFSLLFLAPTFPRSVLYSLRTAETQLNLLQPTSRPTRPQRVIGRLRSDLEFSDATELLAGDVDACLRRVIDDIRWVAELIAVQFFRNSEELSVLHPVETLG